MDRQARDEYHTFAGDLCGLLYEIIESASPKRYIHADQLRSADAELLRVSRVAFSASVQILKRAKEMDLVDRSSKLQQSETRKSNVDDWNTVVEYKKAEDGGDLSTLRTYTGDIIYLATQIHEELELLVKSSREYLYNSSETMELNRMKMTARSIADHLFRLRELVEEAGKAFDKYTSRKERNEEEVILNIYLESLTSCISIAGKRTITAREVCQQMIIHQNRMSKQHSFSRTDNRSEERYHGLYEQQFSDSNEPIGPERLLKPGDLPLETHLKGNGFRLIFKRLSTSDLQGDRVTELPCKEGYLLKASRRGPSAGFKSRWFILTDSELKYYESYIAKQSGQRSMKSWKASDIIRVDSHHGIDMEAKKRFAMKICTSDRILYAYATNKGEHNDWIAALTKVLGQDRVKTVDPLTEGSRRSSIPTTTIIATVVKEGTIKKQVGKFRKWKPRWVVIRGNDMCCFKERGDIEPSKMLHLKNADIQHDKKNKSVFSVKPLSSSRTHYFSCENSSQASEWISILSTLAMPERSMEEQDGMTVYGELDGFDYEEAGIAEIVDLGYEEASICTLLLVNTKPPPNLRVYANDGSYTSIKLELDGTAEQACAALCSKLGTKPQDDFVLFEVSRTTDSMGVLSWKERVIQSHERPFEVQSRWTTEDIDPQEDASPESDGATEPNTADPSSDGAREAKNMIVFKNRNTPFVGAPKQQFKSGFLRKQVGKFKIWKTRWVELRRNELLLFKTREDPTPSKFYLLKDITINIIGQGHATNSYSWCVSIPVEEHGKSVSSGSLELQPCLIYLEADSESAMLSWVQTMREFERTSQSSVRTEALESEEQSVILEVRLVKNFDLPLMCSENELGESQFFFIDRNNTVKQVVELIASEFIEMGKIRRSESTRCHLYRVLEGQDAQIAELEILLDDQKPALIQEEWIGKELPFKFMFRQDKLEVEVSILMSPEVILSTIPSLALLKHPILLKSPSCFTITLNTLPQLLFRIS
eukprot:TRINITY_DN3193_c0_g1_i5.p1 TRINITY_DN3193_c0_g1~~TRINITY_DN3193_c0_g1_i5.p1  ORF type:complete len:993 (+),score=168.72 TRINITY_DN3193_c0_g1_i5:70-3048(+)